MAAHQILNYRTINRPRGWIVANEPEQVIFQNQQTPFQFKDSFITKIADYKIKARVLSTERYWLGEMAQLAPVDVAVGWKEMSDTAVIDKLTISQADRFYFYGWKDKDLIDPRRVANSSANMHLIPANKWIDDQIKILRIGHVVTLTGQLINLQLSDGQVIKSSVTREDSGPGACELMWVTNIEIVD